MKINVSRMVREVIGDGAMSIDEIKEKLAVEVERRKLFDIVKSMYRSGTVTRKAHGNTFLYSNGRETKHNGCAKTQIPGKVKPYLPVDVELVKSKMRTDNVPMSVKIREAVKMLPMYPVDVAYAIGANRRSVTSLISTLQEAGNIERMMDGRYKFLRDPTGRVYKNKGREVLRNVSVSQSQAMNYDPKHSYSGPAQTVEEFIANGGKIDYSDTANKFERLTHEEIVSRGPVIGMGYQSPVSPRLSSVGKW